MDVLKQRIEKFLNVSHGYGDGYGNGYGNGYGDGSGNGYGDGYGYGSGRGKGYNNGYNGEGKGYGSGDGSGNGNGYGNGNGEGDGDGAGDGSDIAEVNGSKLYEIDGIPTAVTSIHGNIAQGFVLRGNQPKPCFVVKGGDMFAHGYTLHDAFLALQEKLYDDSTEEERITAFIQRFPDYDTPYANNALFAYHHVLTGSCRMGREQFCENHGISLSGKTTVRQFVELTKDAYGGDTVQKLTKLYNNNK